MDLKPVVFGKTFANQSSNTYHTFRYDFKPASIDDAGIGKVVIEDGNRVTAHLPNTQGNGSSETTFNGCQKFNPKECLLIIDHETGIITLEKLTSSIQLKKIRQTKDNKQISTNLTTKDAKKDKPDVRLSVTTDESDVEKGKTNSKRESLLLSSAENKNLSKKVVATETNKVKPNKTMDTDTSKKMNSLTLNDRSFDLSAQAFGFSNPTSSLSIAQTTTKPIKQPLSASNKAPLISATSTNSRKHNVDLDEDLKLSESDSSANSGSDDSN